jgi:hypothetical protein
MFDNTKYILPEGAKVSTLVDIRQHKIYFTDYWNRNKSSQKVGWLPEEEPFHHQY